MANLSVSNLGGRKNFIINGAMDIWQAGASFSTLTASTYILDMFNYQQLNDGSMDVVQTTNPPTVANGATFQSNYCLAFNPHAEDVSIGATQYSVCQYKIEGYNYRRLKDRTATLSFWVNSNKTGTYCVAFRNNNNDRCYIAEYTINSANIWKRKL